MTYIIFLQLTCSFSQKIPRLFFESVFLSFRKFNFSFFTHKNSFSLKWLFNSADKKAKKKKNEKKILLNFTSVLVNVTFYHFISRYALFGYRKICFRIYHRLCSPLHRWTLICQFFLTFFFSQGIFFRPPPPFLSRCFLCLCWKNLAFCSTKVRKFRM